MEDMKKFWMDYEDGKWWARDKVNDILKFIVGILVLAIMWIFVVIPEVERIEKLQYLSVYEKSYTNSKCD